jgi:hypothetical protein
MQLNCTTGATHYKAQAQDEIALCNAHTYWFHLLPLLHSQIICEGSSDEETNWLVCKCLGYRYSAADDSWSADDVFANWKSKYPTPPDLIGVTRVSTAAC